MFYNGPITFKNLGGDKFTLRDWHNAPDLKELLVAQNPDLEVTSDSFDLLTYEDVMIDPKIGTLSRRSMMLREYGFDFILLYRDVVETRSLQKPNECSEDI